VTVEALAASVSAAARGPVHVVTSLDELPNAVAAIAREGDLLVTMGAGSIGTVGDRILSAISQGSVDRIQQ
jgi:UDP-N-acetylmuramate--alanine ligase